MLVAESVAGDCPGGGSAVPTAAWMRSALHVTAARAHVEVRAAGLLTVGAGGVVGGDAVAGRPEPAAAPDGAGDLRELGRAVAAGRASAEHVRVACRAMTRHPGHLRAAHRPELAEALTEHACAWAPETADRLARYLLAVLSPDGSDRYDSAALDRRSFAAAVDRTGMVVTHGQHDPHSGAFLTAAVDTLARLDRHDFPVPGTDETGAADPVPGCKHAGPSDDVGGGLAPPLQAPDMRTLTQRRHDALDTLVRAGVAHLAGCDTAGGVGAALAWLIVTTTPDQLAAGADRTGPGPRPGPAREADDVAGHRSAREETAPRSATCLGAGPVGAGFLQLAACDAVADRVELDAAGAVVSMTTRSRYATPAMVRALIARDGGCAAPGCTAPPGLTDAHHIIWWSRGGPTTVGNLTLLCPRHHRDVHADRLEVTARDGVPWFRRPRGRSAGPDDPTLDWHRGSYLDATRRARRLGQRLVADAADRRYRSPPWAA